MIFLAVLSVVAICVFVYLFIRGYFHPFLTSEMACYAIIGIVSGCAIIFSYQVICISSLKRKFEEEELLNAAESFVQDD